MVKSHLNEVDGHYPTRRWIAAMRREGRPEKEIATVVETAAVPETLLTFREASDEFGIPVDTVRTWFRQGHLTQRGSETFHAPGGRRHLVDRDEVVYLIEHPPKRTGRPRKVSAGRSPDGVAPHS